LGESYRVIHNSDDFLIDRRKSCDKLFLYMEFAGNSECFHRYELVLRVIDDADIHRVFGGNPKLERRVRKAHQRYFLAWLREYEREVLNLNRQRIRMLAADGRWVECSFAVKRAAEYAQLCCELRCAALMRTLRVGNPVRRVEKCIGELRTLDSYLDSLRPSITPLPSA
jgi:hypothetical protein